MSLLLDSNISEEKIGNFVISVPAISTSDLGEKAKELFENNAETEGIVVMEYGNPAGIIMRNQFFQKMSSLYGHSLYMKRSVNIVMDSAFLSADADDNISQVGLLATGRDHEKLYDYIVVYKNRRYLGVISIRLFLSELSKRNEAQISVLREQQQKLILAHEQEINLRKHLEYQSAAIRNLLDHAEQGFLWFGSDLIIKNEVSYQCFKIFGKNIGGTRFTDLMATYFEEDRIQVIELALDSYFNNNSPVTDTVYLMLLPADCFIAGKNIHLQYKRIEGEAQKAIMVVMNDITDKISMEMAMEADRYKQRLLIKAIGYQSQIKRMISEFHDLFSGGFRSFFVNRNEFCKNFDELFRTVHTYKGDFAQYGFDSSAEQLHNFEDELMSLSNRTDSISMPELETIFTRFDTNEILKQDLQIIYDFLGEDYFDKSEIISVPKSKLIFIEQQLNENSDITRVEMTMLVRSLLLKPVKAYLTQYADYLEYLSARMRKSPPIFLIEGNDLEIDGDRFDRFFYSLVHIFRNCMDHGIEPDEERVQAGKDQRGLIQCTITALNDKCFTIRISDDGRGINFEKLKAKVLECGIYNTEQLALMSNTELSQLVFEDHITTKDSVSNLSGRGIGMSAVRDACLKLGGNIKIDTCPGEGTTFDITLPYPSVFQSFCGKEC